MLLLLQMILSIWILLNRVDAKPPPGYEKPPEGPDKDPPKYEYSYSIENLDERTGHGKLESRDGELALGRYFVQGDASRQNVEYIADDLGFHPLVEYSNKHSRAHFALGQEAVNALKNSNKTISSNQQQIQGRNDESFENSVIGQTQAVIKNHNQEVHENEIVTERYSSEDILNNSDDENLREQISNQDHQQEVTNGDQHQQQNEQTTDENLQVQDEYKTEEPNQSNYEEQLNTTNNNQQFEIEDQNQQHQTEGEDENEEDQKQLNADVLEETQIEPQNQPQKEEENYQQNTEVETIESETIKPDLRNNDETKENEIKEDSKEKSSSNTKHSDDDNSNHDDYYDNAAVYENNEKILLNEQQNDPSFKYQYLGEFGAKLKPKINKLIENTKNLVSGEDVLSINEAISELSTEASVTENANKSDAVTPYPDFVLTDRSSDGESAHVSLSKQPIVVADYENEDEHVQAGSENFEETRQRDEVLPETNDEGKDNIVDTTESGTVLVTPKPLSTTFLAPINAGVRLETQQEHEIAKNEEQPIIDDNTEQKQEHEVVENEQQHNVVQDAQKQNTFVEVQHSVPYYLGKFEYPSLYNTEVDVKESNSYKIEGAIQNIELGKTLINFPVNSFSEQIQHNNLQPLYSVQQLPVPVKNQPFNNINDQLQESNENGDVVDATNPEGQASVAQALVQTQVVDKTVEKQNHNVPVEVTKSIPFTVIQQQQQQQYPIPVQVSVPVEKFVDKPLPHFLENPIEKNIPQYIEKPYPVEVKIPVPVPQTYYVPVEVPKPYPVEVTKYVAKPYPVPQPYPIQVMETVGVPVAQPIPYEVRVPHPVPVEVPKYIEKIVDRPYPVYITKNQKQQKFYYAPAYLPQKHCDQSKSHSNFYLGLVPPPKNFEQSRHNIQHHHQQQHQHQQQQQQQQQIRKFRNPRSNFNSQNIRLEYGFMPPLIPSLEIDEFGNPIHKDE